MRRVSRFLVATSVVCISFYSSDKMDRGGHRLLVKYKGGISASQLDWEREAVITDPRSITRFAA